MQPSNRRRGNRRSRYFTTCETAARARRSLQSYPKQAIEPVVRFDPQAGMANSVDCAAVLQRRCAVRQFDRIYRAPFAQGSLRSFRCEIMPAIEGMSSCQQRFEFRIGALPAEYISDLMEVVRQKFAGKIQDQRLAETELAFAGDRDIVLVIIDVIGQLVPIRKYRSAYRPCRSACTGRPRRHIQELECKNYIFEVDRH